MFGPVLPAVIQHPHERAPGLKPQNMDTAEHRTYGNQHEISSSVMSRLPRPRDAALWYRFSWKRTKKKRVKMMSKSLYIVGILEHLFEHGRTLGVAPEDPPDPGGEDLKPRFWNNNATSDCMQQSAWSRTQVRARHTERAEVLSTVRLWRKTA